MSSALPGVQVDNTMAAYADDSRHRQKRDVARVIDVVGESVRNAETVVDLGCGVGDLIAQLADLASTDAHILGVDASVHRVADCERRFLADPRCDFAAADLVAELPFAHADVVTMTAVLHWLHPHENSVIEAVGHRLTPGGVFALTTYHPEPEIAGLGGTDAVVAAALHTTDDEVTARFAAAGVTPVSRRTLAAAELDGIAQTHFGRVERRDDAARTAPASGEEFASYFESTFGHYYRPLFASDADMRTQVTEAADKRLAALGYVTDMTVSTWALRAPRRDADGDRRERA